MADMSKELGWPLWLCRMTDKLHEGQSNESKEWPGKIVNAVKEGTRQGQFDIVQAKFFHWLLVDEQYGVARFAKTDQVKTAIEGVASLYEMLVEGQEVTKDQWIEKRSASAYASAYAAADAYAYAAAYAARQTHYSRMADKLVELLTNA